MLYEAIQGCNKQLFESVTQMGVPGEWQSDLDP